YPGARFRGPTEPTVGRAAFAAVALLVPFLHAISASLVEFVACQCNPLGATPSIKKLVSLKSKPVGDGYGRNSALAKGWIEVSGRIVPNDRYRQFFDERAYDKLPIGLHNDRRSFALLRITYAGRRDSGDSKCWIDSLARIVTHDYELTVTIPRRLTHGDDLFVRLLDSLHESGVDQLRIVERYPATEGRIGLTIG